MRKVFALCKGRWKITGGPTATTPRHKANQTKSFAVLSISLSSSAAAAAAAGVRADGMDRSCLWRCRLLHTLLLSATTLSACYRPTYNSAALLAAAVRTLPNLCADQQPCDGNLDAAVRQAHKTRERRRLRCVRSSVGACNKEPNPVEVARIGAPTSPIFFGRPALSRGGLSCVKISLVVHGI